MKSFMQVILSQKPQTPSKIFPKIYHKKILLFRLFKLASSFTWVLKRARTLIRTYSVNDVILEFLLLTLNIFHAFF